MGWIGIGILIGIGLMLAPLMIGIGIAAIYGILVVLLYLLPIAVGAAVGTATAFYLGIHSPAGGMIGGAGGVIASILLYNALNPDSAKSSHIDRDPRAAFVPSEEFRLRVRRAQRVNMFLFFGLIVAAITTAFLVGDSSETVLVLSIFFIVVGLPMILIKMWFDPDLEAEQNRLFEEQQKKNQREEPFFGYK